MQEEPRNLWNEVILSGNKQEEDVKTRLDAEESRIQYFSELLISSWGDAVCWQITQRSFVSDWQWACVEQRDAGHTRIKTELDKIGTKKQEVE